MGSEPIIGHIPPNWEATSLGDVVQRAGGNIQTGPFGSQLHASDYVEKGIPSIMPANIGDGRVVSDGIARITEADALRLSRYRVAPGDIVYSRRGDVERHALVTGDQEGWLCGTGCIKLTVGQGIVMPRYASYYLQHPATRAWISRHAVGATMPNLNTSIMASIPFVLPPFEAQRRIAHILGTLDDKIELNRRMNQTLEKMAAALFKSWFIDFDPVRAKAEGRDPNLPADLANLFPDTFQDSELGPIPAGWEVKPIGEAVRCVGGATPSTKNPDFWEGGSRPFVTPKDLSRLNSPVILDSERHITDAGVQKISSKQLPVGTVILSSRAPIGYLGVATVPVSVNQGIIAMTCDADLPNLYVLHWTQANMDTIKSQAGGTTFAEISKKSFRPISVLVPPRKVLDAFMSHVGPLHKRMVSATRENMKLAALRDTLLPKLLSGELAVSDVSGDVQEGAA